MKKLKLFYGLEKIIEYIFKNMRRKTTKQIRILRAQGYSCQELGDAIGMSKQGISNRVREVK